MQSFTEITADQIDRTDDIKMAELKVEIFAQLLAMLDCPAGRNSGALGNINIQFMEAERRMYYLRSTRDVPHLRRGHFGRHEPTESAFGARAGD